MSRKLDPQTPLRRSKRGQPILADATRLPALQINGPPNVPRGDLVFTRQTRAEDLYDEETGSEGAALAACETRFYAQFTRKELRPAKRPSRVYGRVARNEEPVVGEPEVYSVGDTVLVRTSSKQPSVAVITAIWEVVREGEPDDVGIRVGGHWFNRPTELPSIRARREHLDNEIYYSLSRTVVLPPSQIISTCSVSSTEHTSYTPHSKGNGRVRAVLPSLDPTPLFCRYALDPKRGLFYVFHWEHFRKAILEKSVVSMTADWDPAHAWNVSVANEVDVATAAAAATMKSPRKRARADPKRAVRLKEDEAEEVLPGLDASTEGGDSSMDEVHSLLDAEFLPALERGEDGNEQEIAPPPPTTPRKRKRAQEPTTPRTPRTPRRTKAKTALAEPTPHSKAALRARKRTVLAVRPPPLELAFDLDGAAGKDPWLRAMHVLHVAARPEALPCREEEYGRVLRTVEELLEEGSGGCVYISGVPGTGKTATVHAVVRELKRMAEQNEANPFTFVEINGLRIPEPAAAYGLLWEAVSGHDAARDGHMKISANQALKQLSRHFSAGERAGPGSHACVVLMDELDQLMTSKQDVVYNFFNWPTLMGSKLVVLAVANTMDLPERVMTGRVRSRLGMVRINFQPYTTPQLEKIVTARLLNAKEGLPADTQDVIAPDGIKFAAMKVSSISGDARRVLDICRRTVELVHQAKRTARTDDVKEVIKVMQNSPTAAYLRDLSFHERLMLAALLKCVRKEGVEEIRWGALQHQHLVYLNLLSGGPDPDRRPAPSELRMVLDALLASRALICEDGAAVARRAEDERRVALNLEHAEVERVLGEVGGARWKNALNI